MKFKSLILAITLPLFLCAQVELINTGTNNAILQIHKDGNFVLINGIDYLAKCYYNCDELIPVNLPASPYPIGKISFVDTNVYFAFSSAILTDHLRLFKTENGGDTWDVVFDTSGYHVNDINMFDDSEGVLFSTARKLIRTKDSWQTWAGGYHPSIIATAVQGFRDSTICIGTLGSICLSKNRGNDWVCRSSANALPRKFFFLNEAEIFAVSGGNNGNFFSSSLDGGDSWENFAFSNLQLGFSPLGVYFKNLNEGYVVGKEKDDLGIIISTNDLWKSWRSFNIGLTTTLTDIQFLNDSIALVSGTNGILFKWNKNTAFPTTVKENDRNKVKVQLSPNPATNFQNLNISLEKPAELEITLHDISGRLVKTIHKGKSQVGKTTIEADFSSLAKGMYLYCVSIDGEKQYLKTLKH